MLYNNEFNMKSVLKFNSMKKQIVIIHGGDTFKTYEQYLRFLKRFQIDFNEYRTGRRGWKDTLAEKLGEEYEVIRPEMPCRGNAKYPEWQIWFEKFILHLAGEVVLVGHSLGGAFLAKYLSENTFPKKIKGVFLVAPVYDTDSEGYSPLSFSPPKKINLQTKNVFLYHSTDDKIVPHSQLNKFSQAIPNATIKQFTDRGHFNQEEFPELVEDIKNL